jgi:hypothetical protein
MIHEIVLSDKPSPQKNAHYNDAPPNLRMITAEEFAQSHFFTYTPQLVESRYILNKVPKAVKKARGKEDAFTLHMFWMHDGTGYGFEQDYWGKKVIYYTFAVCEHDFVEIGNDGKRCYHVYECKKCGYQEAHDSSD